jgi:integrase
MLNLYRRHLRSGCPAGHKPDSQSYESDERRPKWKHCLCPIYASGKLGDHPKFRQNTKRLTFAEARTAAEAWERRALEVPPPPPDPASPPLPTAKPRREIATAVERTLAEYRSNESALATVRRAQCVLKKFRQFSTGVKGYAYLDQWTDEDVAEFRLWWGYSERYQRKNLSFLRTFFSRHKKYIAENPADAPKRSPNRKQREAAQAKQKSPFTDAHLDNMLAACRRYPNYGGPPQKFFGEDLADFILISTYTGLRISDMATFHVSRMTGDGNIHFRAIKNGKWVDTWVPQWLQDIIWKRAEKWGPYIFGARSTDDPVVLGTTWRVRLNKLWSLCEPFEEPPTHHRFRHTFVRILLENGTPVRDVADLLGDTEEVVRQSYSKWVPERQERLTGVLRAAFANKPRLYAVK